MNKFEGWTETTSSDNLKQFLATEDIKGQTDRGEIKIETGSILLGLPNEEGVNLYYLREELSSGIYPEGITIGAADISGLTEIDGGIPRYSKDIDSNNYRFTIGDFIYIFKPKHTYTSGERQYLTEILEKIIQCYIQDETDGTFTLKEGIYESLEAEYKSYVDYVGDKLDYINMAIKLGQISNSIHETIVSKRSPASASLKSKSKKSSKKRPKKKRSKKRSKKSKSKKKRSKKRKTSKRLSKKRKTRRIKQNKKSYRKRFSKQKGGMNQSRATQMEAASRLREIKEPYESPGPAPYPSMSGNIGLAPSLPPGFVIHKVPLLMNDPKLKLLTDTTKIGHLTEEIALQFLIAAGGDTQVAKSSILREIHPRAPTDEDLREGEAATILGRLARTTLVQKYRPTINVGSTLKPAIYEILGKPQEETSTRKLLPDESEGWRQTGIDKLVYNNVDEVTIHDGTFLYYENNSGRLPIGSVISNIEKKAGEISISTSMRDVLSILGVPKTYTKNLIPSHTTASGRQVWFRDEILGYNDNDVIVCRDSLVHSIENESGRLPIEIEGDDV